MSDEVDAFVAAGSNLGDRARFLADAEVALGRTPGVTLVVAGPVEETAPLGGMAQPAYLNRMFRIRTTLPPLALLATCHGIERAAGRERTTRWASRTLDLDLVRYGDLLCDWPELVLPHPGLRDRTFWAREISQLESNA